MWLFGLYVNKGNNKISIEEFRQIFIEFYPDLCLYASKFVHDFETSKDIVQEVFTQFWEESEKLQNKNFIKPYLYKAVKNRSLNYNKREKRILGLDELFEEYELNIRDSANQNAISLLSFKALQNDLEEAINELPEQRQKIF